MTTETLLLSIAMAAASGLVGSFAVMRRMSLAADPLSHVALPGIGIALAHIHPIFGAVTMLLFGGLLVWALEEHTRAATETIIGVVFSAALAIGSITTSGEDLIDALFGGAGTLSRAETVFGLTVAIAVVLFVLFARDRLVIALVSPDLARTTGIHAGRLDLLYLEAFALTIALGLRYLGVLLMGALIIVPAATAARLARNLTGMLSLAVIIPVGCTVAGTWIGPHFHRQTGPVIILIATAIFLFSLVPRPHRRR